MFVSKYRREVLEMNYIASRSLHGDEPSTEENVSHDELLEEYQTALNHLNEKQRTVFLMSRMEGIKYQEIAERLGLSVKAVEKRMSAAIKILKQSLLA